MKPFISLKTPRMVHQLNWPTDLSDFYARHEGVGRECLPDRVIRLHNLHEILKSDWVGLRIIWDATPDWESFSGYHIGFGIYFEEIVYVLSAPTSPPGSILALGGSLEFPLVLAKSLAGWLVHLERWGWAEPAIAPAWELSAQEWSEVHQYYFSLNPEWRVPENEPSNGPDSAN